MTKRHALRHCRAPRKAKWSLGSRARSRDSSPTAVMTILEVPAWRRRGFAGILDWEQNQTMAARLLGRPAEELVAAGLGLHFSHGVLAGLVFALGLAARRSFSRPLPQERPLASCSGP